MEISNKAKRILTTLPVEKLLRFEGENSITSTNINFANKANFHEYKAYSLGDETKWIDWKIYARRERLYTKKYASELARSTLIVVDGSASMQDGFLGQEQLSKRGQTVWTRVKGVLGYLLYYLYIKKEPYGLAIVRDNTLAQWKIGQGGNQLTILQKAIAKENAFGSNNYMKKLMTAVKASNEINNILFISDFQMEQSQLATLVKHAKNNQIALSFLCFLNERLSNFSFIGGLRWLKDSESGRKLLFNKKDMQEYKTLVSRHYDSLSAYAKSQEFQLHLIDFRERDELENFVGFFQNS